MVGQSQSDDLSIPEFSSLAQIKSAPKDEGAATRSGRGRKGAAAEESADGALTPKNRARPSPYRDPLEDVEATSKRETPLTPPIEPNQPADPLDFANHGHLQIPPPPPEAPPLPPAPQSPRDPLDFTVSPLPYRDPLEEVVHLPEVQLRAVVARAATIAARPPAEVVPAADEAANVEGDKAASRPLPAAEQASAAKAEILFAQVVADVRALYTRNSSPAVPVSEARAAELLFAQVADDVRAAFAPVAPAQTPLPLTAAQEADLLFADVVLDLRRALGLPVGRSFAQAVASAMQHSAPVLPPPFVEPPVESAAELPVALPLWSVATDGAVVEEAAPAPHPRVAFRLQQWVAVAAVALAFLAAAYSQQTPGPATTQPAQAAPAAQTSTGAKATPLPAPAAGQAATGEGNPAPVLPVVPAEAAGAGAGARNPLDPAFPFTIDIVTPTPRAGEELLFRDPLVASEEEPESLAVAPQQISFEQPVILPALAAQANGGNAIAAPSLADLALPHILPAASVALIPDLATPTPTAQPVATAAPILLEPGRPWSTFAPAENATHFWVGRPHPSFVLNQIAAPSYQFGSTGDGKYRPHHGMDIANTFGTPVRAATTGEVVHAGLDDTDLLGPYGNFYGYAVVIRLDRRLSVAGGELDVYLLYGHMSEVTVSKGQRVQPDDIVGMVGMSGIAIGPHLHVEIRVGANNYEASVNPYLWVEPPPGAGAVAVRLLTADGRTWPRARVTIARFEGNLATWARVMEIYPDNESINPDPAFGDNGAMEAVPAGVYYLVAVVNGERVAAEAVVRPGETTFVEMRTQQ